MNLYILSGSQWIVSMPDGKKLYFGSSVSSRIAHPDKTDAIYAWNLDEERDMFGHQIRYSYFLD
jgi:hypothetical protein